MLHAHRQRDRQLRALLEDGGLAYPASPLVFWLMAPLAAWLGPLAGAKLGAAALGALVAVPAFGLGRRLGGRSAGLVAAALATIQRRPVVTLQGG